MGKSKTPSFCLTLRLLPNKDDKAELEKRFHMGAHLYNVCVKEALKRLNKLLKNREFQALIRKPKKTDDDKKKLKALREKYDLIGRYSLESYLNKGRQKFEKHIDADACAKIAQTVWCAVEEFLFKDGECIHYKRFSCFTSMEGKTNKQSIRFRDENIKWKGLCIPVRVKNKDFYAKQCIQNNRVKYCRIKRKWHKHEWRYYADLVMEGLPPMKKRKMGKGRVGIDIGTSTIAAVSEANMVFRELNDGIESIDAEIRRLNRKLDRQRRANNPDNYNVNGTVKRDSKNFHKVWKKSKRQRLTEDKIRERYAKRSAKLSQFQDDLANEIVSMGDEIVIETMNFQGLQKKAKKTEKSTKTGRYKKKKRFGKSISIHAPSSLIRKIKIRLAYHKGNLIEVDPYKMKASQTNHITGECMPSDLKSRWKVLVPGTLVQRDLYSAFLLFNAKNKEEIDFELCEQTFDNFFDGHNRLIDELRKQKKEGKVFPSCMGI